MTLGGTLRKLRTGYIAEAFRLARQADPDVLLIYNDYSAEGMNRKSDDVYNLVRDLLQQGVPIGGGGLQMHLDASSLPAVADIARNMRRLAELGLLVNISEMDVRVARVSGDLSAKLTDRHSWIDSFFGPDDPLLFDDSYRAKPSYYGTLDALRGR